VPIACREGANITVAVQKHARQSQARALALLVREIDELSLENLGHLLGRDLSGLTKLANRLEIKRTQDEEVERNILEMRRWLLLDNI
jgi:hypothetical protein